MGGLLDEVHAQADDALELHLVGHQVVGGGDDDRGIGADGLDAVVGVGQAGSRVAAHGLTEHLLGIELG